MLVKEGLKQSQKGEKRKRSDEERQNLKRQRLRGLIDESTYQQGATHQQEATHQQGATHQQVACIIA